MKKSIGSVFLAFVFLAVLVSGCAPAPTPVPSTSTPLPTKTPAPTNTSVPTRTPIPATDMPAELNSDWLITEKDLNEFTNDIGISYWELEEDVPGNFRICRNFIGTSWSANLNLAANCINRDIPPTFEEVIAHMYELEVLYPTDIKLEPVLSYDHDFALYTYQADNGQSSYNAFLVSDGLLFRATVTVGTPGGYTPETLFDEQGEIIETFLKNILMINLERRRTISSTTGNSNAATATVQVEGGSIQGNISWINPNHPIANVKVEINKKEHSKIFETLTDQNGDYNFSNLDPGIYFIMVAFKISKNEIYCENPILGSTATDTDSSPAVPRLLTDKLLMSDLFKIQVSSAENSKVDFQLSCP